MFTGWKLVVLVVILVLINITVLVLEWNAVSGLHAGIHQALSLQLDQTHSGGRELSAKLRGGRSPEGSHKLNHKSGHTTQAPIPKPAYPPFPTPPPVRDNKCLHKKWDYEALPRVSLIIPYLNETWFHIQQTTASMIAHSPMDLIDEILFIDDGNSPEWQFHKELTALHPKVKVHRNEQRQGLIRAKVIGAEIIKSPVIIFMEPHCIVQPEWIEPLLEKLVENNAHKTLVMPQLDIIPEDDWNKYMGANHHIGGFDWSLSFNWMALAEARDKSYKYPAPYKTPALSGGIFGIWKDHWISSGTYDTNMTEWGGEHIEMSLRTWRCGGEIYVVPCSRIGHVFRKKNPYVVHNVEVLKNTKRAALVWLDDHLEDFYKKIPYARTLDAGDVSDRLKLKESLKCESMDWYIQNVYPELLGNQRR
eukprot:TRINITY_DN18965_c0_g1_i1.p1 TRINITY_DN18965_c0_g1~~TRINITY_DN18965_c0_g1_i1.p1  ORF type:complete len:419 (-),score=49.33 TRINITY_DN18965_c0_g1_i1:151-1407(-)